MSLPPKRVYFVRAILDWIHACEDTPYLLADTSYPGVEIPAEHARENRLVLDISQTATHNLEINESGISFEARFSGISRFIFVPLGAALAVYGKHSGDGMVFPPEFSLAHTPATSSATPVGSLKVIK